MLCSLHLEAKLRLLRALSGQAHAWAHRWAVCVYDLHVNSVGFALRDVTAFVLAEFTATAVGTDSARNDREEQANEQQNREHRREELDVGFVHEDIF